MGFQAACWVVVTSHSSLWVPSSVQGLKHMTIENWYKQKRQNRWKKRNPLHRNSNKTLIFSKVQKDNSEEDSKIILKKRPEIASANWRHRSTLLIADSNKTFFFRFVAKRAIYRLGIISLAHAPVHVTDFPVVNVHVNELSSARIWQHKLCATLSANVNINCRLPIEVQVYYGICTLRHIRIEIIHGIISANPC